MTLDSAFPHRPRTPRRRAALALAALAVALGVAGGTQALWSGGAAATLPLLRTGDLDVALGEATWYETSPDVDAAPRTIEPARFLATPGDVVVLRQDVVTTQEGDNIAGELTVRWGDRLADVPDGVAATYQVRGPDDAVTAEVPVGVSVGLPGTPAGRATWTVRIEFVLDPEADVHYGDGPASSVPVPLADLGDMVFDLRQVRSGPGFTS